MSKETKIDESFNFGPIEVTRSGKVVSMINHANEDEREQFLKYFSDGYEDQDAIH